MYISLKDVPFSELIVFYSLIIFLILSFFFCYGFNIYVSSKFIVEIRMPNMMVSRGGAIGKLLCHEGEALMDRINALIKETPRRSPDLLPCEVSLQLRKGPSPEPNYSGTLVLEFQPPDL